MKNINLSLITSVLVIGSTLTSMASPAKPMEFDLAKFHYQIADKSAFNSLEAKRSEYITRMIDPKATANDVIMRANPSPDVSLAPSTQTGNIDAPDGELWYYTGDFDYEEIPPHDDISYTERILRSWTFNIYNSKMELIGTIKDTMDYEEGEVRVSMCEMTPVATRNFFNTDDKVELIVALGVNRESGGNNYRSLVYSLGGEVDVEGNNVPVTTFKDLVGDVAEGPASADGSDNYYITLMADVFDEVADGEDVTFWDYLMAQKVGITVYGKALDNSGPRKLYETTLPMIQLPGDQENIAPLMSMRRGDDVVYCFSYYKLPFYNPIEDIFSEDMTQREGNSLMIDLFKATETSFTKFSSTEIPVQLDPMNNNEGNPTCLFSYFSVGSLRYTGDILFDAPGASASAPDFIITRGNYQVTTDGVVNSYFTYKADGTLKNTLFLYADGTLSLGDLPGYEPQQVFVYFDRFGYVYNFVDLYSARTAATVDALFYINNDAEPELLAANMARFLDGDSYKYVFEMRYPVVDENENDLMRFMYLSDKGKFDHIDYVNMGKNVDYAQSYLSTEAVAPHAYSTSDVPAYMFLVKRGDVYSYEKTEELMIAEAVTTDNPQGKTLLQLSSGERGVLASIFPEFAKEGNPGRLFVYYYDSTINKYALDIYALPLSDGSGSDLDIDADRISIINGKITAEGSIVVYTTDGRMVASADSYFDSTTLPRGIYVLIADGKAYKFINK